MESFITIRALSRSRSFYFHASNLLFWRAGLICCHNFSFSIVSSHFRQSLVGFNNYWKHNRYWFWHHISSTFWIDCPFLLTIDPLLTFMWSWSYSRRWAHQMISETPLALHFLPIYHSPVCFSNPFSSLCKRSFPYSQLPSPLLAYVTFCFIVTFEPGISFGLTA